MIRIIKIRFNETKAKKYSVLTKQKADSIAHLFKFIDSYLENIPESERYDLHYSLAEWEDASRTFVEQHVIPIDIDDIDLERIDEYHQHVQKAFGIDLDRTAIVCSGNGLHYLIGLEDPITDPTFFERNRENYKYLMFKLNNALEIAGLAGHGDAGPFRDKATLRLPNTLNIKKGIEKKCYFIESHLFPQGFSLGDSAGSPVLNTGDYMPDSALKRYPKPDTRSVIDECLFVQHCRDNQDTVSEPAWYAMLSVVGRLEKGRSLCHQYSSSFKGYDQQETDIKIDQAIASSGPRTCQNIGTLWDGCPGCKHADQIKSPVLIKGKDFIATKETGFHFVEDDAQGNPKVKQPDYEGLRKHFEQEHQYMVLSDTRIMYTFNGTHWEFYSDVEIEAFAERNFDPDPNIAKVKEFKAKLYRTQLRHSNWLSSSIEGKMNFKNGVLDMHTLGLTPHSVEHGFQYVLDYDYEPTADCPRFDKFMQEISCNREELAEIMLQFSGYAFANHECNPPKAMVLLGEGQNGKSTFMKVLQKLAGKKTYSALTLAELKSDVYRYQLQGKLFNMAEETPTKSLMDSSTFKNLVSGGETTVKMLYKQPYLFQNRAKLMFACNELPTVTDATKGMFRRLILIPFDACFDGQKEDMNIEAKLYSELPGIFNRIIDAYQRFRITQRFPQSDSSDQAIEEYRQEVDTVYLWKEECLHLKPLIEDDKNDFIVNAKLFQHYRHYTEGRKKQPISDLKFYHRLSKMINKDRKGRVTIRHKKVGVYKCVELFEDMDYQAVY